MARIASLDILLTTTGKDYLAEQYGAVIENVQKACISSALKNTALSGTPEAGSVEAKRFENRTSNAYGTARSGNAGQKVKAKPVTIQIATDKELITEIEQKDVSLYGVDAFVEKQAAMDQASMIRELERAFFTEAVNAGTLVTISGTPDAPEIAESMIQAVETVSNNFVDGVDRDNIALVLKPAFYGKLRTYMDKVQDGGAHGEEITLFHGVKVYSSVYLPATDDETSANTLAYGCVMAIGSVAQPVLPTICAPERPQFSNAVATGLFYSYGTKAVSEDLIFYA